MESIGVIGYEWAKLFLIEASLLHDFDKFNELIKIKTKIRLHARAFRCIYEVIRAASLSVHASLKFLLIQSTEIVFCSSNVYTIFVNLTKINFWTAFWLKCQLYYSKILFE